MGQRVRNLRKQKNMVLKELAERTGISASFLGDIESGRSNPSLERLKDIANGLGVSISFLLGEDDNPSQDAKGENAGMEHYLDERIARLTEMPGFDKVLEYLYDYGNWTEEDREELLAYLRAKQLVRGSRA